LKGVEDMIVMAIVGTILGLFLLYGAVDKYKKDGNKVDLTVVLFLVLILTYFPILYLIGGVTHG
jgi:hypothetical protein